MRVRARWKIRAAAAIVCFWAAGTLHGNTLSSGVYAADKEITKAAAANIAVAGMAVTSTDAIKDKDYADEMAPIVTFSMDTSDVSCGKYYHSSKVLTITVMEHNFDPGYVPTVYTDNAQGYFFSGWHVDKNMATGTVTFMEDGMYTVHFECFDLAGNKSNTAIMPQIYIDKTVPELSVTFDNNDCCDACYYNAARKAVITIKEKNFNAEDVQVTVTKNGKDMSSVINQWVTSGENHRAEIDFCEDARYTLAVAYKDLSGNSAVNYKSNAFVIDTTKPEVNIKGVTHQSSDNKSMSPCIEIADVNFNADETFVVLNGGKQGSILLDDLILKETNTQGQKIVFKNFSQMADDIYTLSVKSKDSADNENEQVIEFRINTAGSSYMAEPSAQAMMDRYYVPEPSDIVIKEVNVDEIVFNELICARDGQMTVLEENTDYTVTHQIRENQWHQYTYSLNASCFEQEGCYSIHIYSKDGAGNTVTNMSKKTFFQFAVDHTAPLMTVSNLVNGTHYKDTAHEFSVSVKDNIKLDSMSWYLNDCLVETLDEQALAALDYTVKITLDDSDAYQNIYFHAVDCAGNSLYSEIYSVLVTKNWKAYLGAYGIRILCIVLCAFLCIGLLGTGAACVYRRRIKR